ncbi:hypothetical protein CCACVL1_01693, partial [Corchorus capsularis]
QNEDEEPSAEAACSESVRVRAACFAHDPIYFLKLRDS